jgi:hypothetical protein
VLIATLAGRRDRSHGFPTAGERQAVHADVGVAIGQRGGEFVREGFGDAHRVEVPASRKVQERGAGDTAEAGGERTVERPVLEQGGRIERRDRVGIGGVPLPAASSRAQVRRCLACAADGRLGWRFCPAELHLIQLDRAVRYPFFAAQQPGAPDLWNARIQARGGGG